MFFHWFCSQIQRSHVRLLALMAWSISVWLVSCVPALAQDIYAWGALFGPTPVPVHSLVPGVFALAAGREHSLGTNGEFACAWGNNGSGQLGDGTTVSRLEPMAVHNLTDVLAVAGGGAHSHVPGRHDQRSRCRFGRWDDRSQGHCDAV